MEKIPEFKEVLNVRETAQLLGVHENTVRNLVAKGQLQPTEIPGSAVNRFARKDVMKFLNKTSSADEGLVTRFRRPGLATASDISIWADEPAARGLFPELIRRLLVASGVTNLKSRTLDQVHSPGWDASCTSSGTSFLPAGELRFEIGTNADAKDKAQRDYKKRSEGSANPDQINYIVVTARIWSNNSVWVEKRNADGIFKSVSVIDAHEVWQWLQEYPVEHIWFSKQLGLNTTGAYLLTEWWANFQSTLKINLSEELFLAGRDKSLQTLLEFMQDADNGGQLILESSSAVDMQAFVYAAAVKSGIDLEKVIVVSEDDSLARIMKSSEQLLVVLPDRFDLTAVQNIKKHKVVLLTDLTSSYSRKPGIRLETIPLNLAISALKKSVLEEENLHGLALLARKSMSTFLDSIALDSRASMPVWLQDKETSMAIAMLLLVGRWELSDTRLLESLTNLDYSAIEDLLCSLSDKTDPPFVAVGGSWRPVYLQNLIMLTSSVIGSPRLKNAFTLIQEAIEEDKISRTAISGILRSLVIRIIALEDQGSTQELNFFQGFVNWVTLRTFGSGRDLSTLHPLLAEANPNGYLDLFDDQKFVSDSVSKYFPESEGSTEGRFVSMLWSLELLARNQRYFSRAGHALATLQKYASFIKMANKPLTSLRNICLPQWAFGGTDFHAKLSLLRSILDLHPDTGWLLVMELWPTRHLVMIPPHSPIFRDYETDTQQTPQNEWLEFETEIVNLVSSVLAIDEAKWVDIIPRLDDLQPANMRNLLDQLNQAVAAGFMSVDTNFDVWSKIQSLIQRHKEAAGASWVFSSSDLVRFESILKLLPQAEDSRKYLHLFTWDYEFAYADGDTTRMDLSPSQEQKTALSSLRTNGAAMLIELASSCERPEKLGRVLASEFDLSQDEISEFILSDDRKALVSILNYLDTKTRSNGVDWLAAIIFASSKLDSQKKIVRAIPANNEGFDLLRKLDIQLQETYWAQVNPYSISDGDAETMASKLMEFGNISGAIVVVANQIEKIPVPADLVLEVVQAFVNSKSLSIRNDTMTSYHLGKLLVFLERSDVDKRILAELEFMLFDEVRNNQTTEALYELLNSSPKDLVDICMLFISPESESKFGRGLEATARAGIAYSIYHNWRMAPGETEEGKVDVEGFSAWIHGARDEFDRVGKLAIGDEILGQISARCGRGEDGFWPADHVRLVVEKLKSESFENGLYIGKANLRGVTTRGLTDGGGQEKMLSNEFLDAAVNLELQHSRTSKVNRRLAAKYAREAEFFDADAERFSGD